MRVLIADYHAGCIQSLALMLEEAGATVSVLSKSAHDFIFDEEDSARWTMHQELQLKVRRDLGLGSGIRSAVRSNLFFKKSRSEPVFDLAVGMFPPAIALKLHRSGLARHTLMLAAHRADLHIRSRIMRNKFWKKLAKLTKLSNFHLASVSAFDKAYIESFLGRGTCELLELNAPHILRRRNLTPNIRGTLVFGVHRLLPEFRKPFLDSLSQPIHIAEEVFVNGYTYESLLSFAEFAYVPYSAYSISLLELEASGRPVSIPSDEMLKRSETLVDVRLWPLYARKKSVISFDKNYPQSLNLDDADSFGLWLQLAQWNQSDYLRAGGVNKRNDSRSTTPFEVRRASALMSILSKFKDGD